MSAKRHFTTLLLSLFALILAFGSNAQNICHNGDRANSVVSFDTEKSSFSFDPNEEYHVPVYIYSFRENATGGYESMTDIQTGLNLMIDDFSDMNIFFDWSCIHEIDDSHVYNEEILNTTMNVYLENNYVHSDGISIFIFGPDHALTSWGPTGSFNGGYSFEAFSGTGERYIYMGGTFPYEPLNRAVETHLWSHEMGHALGLEHTFRLTNTTTNSNTDPTLGACRELVDGSNCEECGDFLCTTPASYNIGSSNLANCTESTSVYEIVTGSLYTPIVTNIMEYPTSNCMIDFTVGNGDEHYSQESRMKYFLENEPWLSSLPSPNETITVSVCAGNFQPLCGPNDDGKLVYSYQWYYNNPITQTSTLVSGGTKGGPCYTPTQYGSFTVVYTDQFGCSNSVSYNIVQGYGPNVHIDDVKYCNEKGSPFPSLPPSSVGLPGPFSDALSYSWTYDDNSGSGPIAIFGSSHQTSYLGDGTYCVTILWSDANVPSLLGCTSEACFDVEECCQPNVEFFMEWEPAGNSSTLTVWNNPLNTSDYDLEQFILYEDCNGNGWVQSATPIITRTSNFNVPVVFSGLDESCDYKVVHRVSSNCLRQSFVFQKSVSGALKIEVYPNPSRPDAEIHINMVSNSPNSTLIIYNMITGSALYEGSLSQDEPTLIDRNTLAPGQYIVKVNNGKSVTHEILIVR